MNARPNECLLERGERRRREVGASAQRVEAVEERALAIVRSAAGEERGEPPDAVLSTQVLQEFYVTVTRKLARPLSPDDAERAVHKLAALPVVLLDRPMVLEAISTARRHHLSLWDALILHAALEGGCSRVLTEDLQDGFQFRSVVVENPFRERVEEPSPGI